MSEKSSCFHLRCMILCKYNIELNDAGFHLGCIILCKYDIELNDARLRLTLYV